MKKREMEIFIQNVNTRLFNIERILKIAENSKSIGFFPFRYIKNISNQRRTKCEK